MMFLYKLKGSLFFLSCLVLTLNCFQKPENENKNFHYKSDEKREEITIQTCTFPSPLMAAFNKVWTEFSSQNELKIASKMDFNFPETLLPRRYKSDIEMWMQCPVITGDFNYDGIDDFLVLTVNNQIKSDNKFSLVIFNVLKSRKENNKILFSPKFIYQNRNLSNVYVGKSRAGLSISKFQEDGSLTDCNVKWNSKIQSYQCVKLP